MLKRATRESARRPFLFSTFFILRSAFFIRLF